MMQKDETYTLQSEDNLPAGEDLTPEEEQQAVELPLVIKLNYPILVGTAEITELTIKRRPQARDLNGVPVDSLTADNVLTILGRLCGVAPGVLAKLDLKDFMQAQKAITSFL